MAPLEKPSSERFSKTVMPNATRTLPPQDPFQMAARSSAMGGQMAGDRSRSAAAIRARFHSGPRQPRQRDLPPAVALALEPKVERVISLELGRRCRANARAVMSSRSRDRREPPDSAEGLRGRERDGQWQTVRFARDHLSSRCRKFSCARSRLRIRAQVQLAVRESARAIYAACKCAPIRSGTRPCRRSRLRSCR